MSKRARPLQPLTIRLTHWANVFLLFVMVGSGLRIFDAFPSFGPRGATYPIPTAPIPEAITIGGWLAGARAWHFGFAWLFVANGLVYVAYFFLSGAWRDRLFHPRRDTPGAWRMALHYLRLGPAPQLIGMYNGLQRLAYTSSLLFAAGSVLTGLVLLMPVQLGVLRALVGGYDPGRVLHFALLLLLVGFTLVHVVTVALHPRTFPPMITGGRTETPDA